MLKRASTMRANPTEPERRMWNALRSSRLQGHKFRRQATIGHRIVDFFCPAKGLVIEIDGDTHSPAEDTRRDQLMMRQFGFSTVRFTNHDVMRNLDGVLERLLAVVDSQPGRWKDRDRHHPPAPSSKEEGEKTANAPSSKEEGEKAANAPSSQEEVET